MIFLLALAAAAIPAIPILQVSNSQLAKARAYWLLGLLTIGIWWLARSEMWLALIAFAFLCRWRTNDPLPSVLQWIGIGVSWYFLLQIPSALYDWIAIAWIGVALWQVVLLTERYWRIRKRMLGSFGSPAITAMYLALLVPLTPWWLWPLLLVGLGITCSWLAVAAVAASLMWLYPAMAPWLAGIGVLVVSLWAWSPRFRGRRLGEWTLRGDTLDSVWARIAVWRIVPHDLTHHGSWAFGVGPNQGHKFLRAWASRIRIELPHECHAEALQMLYEYGIVGLLAVVAFAWRIGTHLTLGDPWSAAWIGAGVLSLGHWPYRHATIGPVILAISARVVLG